MAAKRKAAPAPHVETGDDPVPQNIDDIRAALARRIILQPRNCRASTMNRKSGSLPLRLTE
jgi:hypothetical protein